MNARSAGIGIVTRHEPLDSAQGDAMTLSRDGVPMAEREELLQLAADIVSAHVSNHSLLAACRS